MSVDTLQDTMPPVSDYHLSPNAKLCMTECLEHLGDVLEVLPERDQQLFSLRLQRWFQNLFDGLAPVYGHRKDFNEFIQRLIVSMATGYANRPVALKLLDIKRDLQPDWFQHESMLGYVFYVEQFAGKLKDVVQHVDYLEELGASYVHLMKVMQARDGEDDGGYAVTDYARVDKSLGSNKDLEDVCTALRARGISPCVDLVLNHCAEEHPWAQAARDGDEHYQHYFYMFDDRLLPDAFEQTLPEVFPEFAPGNFTLDEISGKWVWTTFNHFQWDLNWSNPEVFLEIADVMFSLANLGVEVFRLDAVAFMWKRMGTDCQNQEEVFDLMQALRTCSRIATPSVAHKAEAIVGPDDLIRYFGVGRHHGKVSNIAYHNSLMVQYWSSIASRDTTLMTHALSEFPRTPNSIAWATYLRCHDDIGWAIADDDAHGVHMNPYAHRHFLSDFYSGEFAGSFARGVVFQQNPVTGDRRINGSFASLAGLEKALEDGNTHYAHLALQRMLLGYALICGFGGMPLLYMGDEIGLLNDYGFSEVAEHANDSRWVHRPKMDWQKAELRHDTATLEGRLFSGVIGILQARRRTQQLSSRYDTDILDLSHPQVFANISRHPVGSLIGLYNFTEQTQLVRIDDLPEMSSLKMFDELEQHDVPVRDGHVHLSAYGRLWLT